VQKNSLNRIIFMVEMLVVQIVLPVDGAYKYIYLSHNGES